MEKLHVKKQKNLKSKNAHLIEKKIYENEEPVRELNNLADFYLWKLLLKDNKNELSRN